MKAIPEAAVAEFGQDIIGGWAVEDVSATARGGGFRRGHGVRAGRRAQLLRGALGRPSIPQLMPWAFHARPLQHNTRPPRYLAIGSIGSIGKKEDRR